MVFSSSVVEMEMRLSAAMTNFQSLCAMRHAETLSPDVEAYVELCSVMFETLDELTEHFLLGDYSKLFLMLNHTMRSLVFSESGLTSDEDLRVRNVTFFERLQELDRSVATSRSGSLSGPAQHGVHVDVLRLSSLETGSTGAGGGRPRGLPTGSGRGRRGSAMSPADEPVPRLPPVQTLSVAVQVENPTIADRAQFLTYSELHRKFQDALRQNEDLEKEHQYIKEFEAARSRYQWTKAMHVPIRSFDLFSYEGAIHDSQSHVSSLRVLLDCSCDSRDWISAAKAYDEITQLVSLKYEMQDAHADIVSVPFAELDAENRDYVAVTPYVINHSELSENGAFGVVHAIEPVLRGRLYQDRQTAIEFPALLQAPAKMERDSGTLRDADDVGPAGPAAADDDENAQSKKIRRPIGGGEAGTAYAGIRVSLEKGSIEHDQRRKRGAKVEAKVQINVAATITTPEVQVLAEDISLLFGKRPLSITCRPLPVAQMRSLMESYVIHRKPLLPSPTAAAGAAKQDSLSARIWSFPIPIAQRLKNSAPISSSLLALVEFLYEVPMCLQPHVDLLLKFTFDFLLALDQLCNAADPQAASFLKMLCS
eukprot:ANDGO_03027.mRNA.1 hypothetical protein